MGGGTHVGREVIAVLPVGCRHDPVRPSDNEERCSSGKPPERFLVLAESLCLAHDPREEDIRGNDGDKEEALTDDS